MTVSIRPVWYSVLTGLLLAGCSPEPASLAVKLYLPSPRAAGLRGQPPQKGEFPPGITDFRLCVSAEDMDKPVCENFNKADYLAEGKARLGGIPAGEDRRVTFQGYDFGEPTEDKVLWCGELNGVRIKKDSTTRISMFITACTDFTYVRVPPSVGRVFHTATRLADGRVVVIGGFNYVSDQPTCNGADCYVSLNATASIEIYDPTTGSFSEIGGLQLNTPRALHTATLLPSGQRILVAGGCSYANWYTGFEGLHDPIAVPADGLAGTADTAEIITIDGQTGSVTPVEGTLPSMHAWHGAAALANGDVLLIGGIDETGSPSKAVSRFVYATQQVEASTPLQEARRGFAMFKVSDQPDRFLLWGGNMPLLPGDGNFAEIMEAGSDGAVTTLVADMVSQQSSKGLSVLGPAGDTYSQKVLVTGGMLVHDKRTSITKPDVLWSYRVIDTSATSPVIIVPSDNSDPNMAKFRAFHTVSLLEKPMSLDDEGPRLLVAGGLTVAGAGNVYFAPQDEVEFFLSWEENPASAFTVHQIKGRTIGLNEPRAGHTATTLDDGTVLIVGGFTGEGVVSISSSAEIFNPRHRNLRVE